MQSPVRQLIEHAHPANLHKTHCMTSSSERVLPACTAVWLGYRGLMELSRQRLIIDKKSTFTHKTKMLIMFVTVLFVYQFISLSGSTCLICSQNIIFKKERIQIKRNFSVTKLVIIIECHNVALNNRIGLKLQVKLFWWCFFF